MRLVFRSQLVAGVALTVAAFSVGFHPRAACGQTAGQAVPLVEPPTPLLPKQFGAWQQVPESGGAVGAATVSVDVISEDGVVRTATASYKRDAANESVSVKAWQFGDTTGAFSAFTYLRGPLDRPVGGVKLGNGAVERGDSVLIWNGPTVVEAEFHGGRRVADLADLVAVLPKVGGPKGQPPLLPTLLPTKGLEPETMKYALGPAGYQAMSGVLPAAIIGFDKAAETVTAKYAGRGTLTMLLYPTPTLAGEHGRRIEAEMNGEIAAGHNPGTVKLRREGPLLLLTTGAWPSGEAQKLVDGIHLQTELTWNKDMPLEFHAEVRKTASLLLTIAELSFVLMIAAVVLGFFFGGGRAMIRVLQGKPAATEPEFLHLDLRERPGEGDFKRLH
jgi:hypothetical protein